MELHEASALDANIRWGLGTDTNGVEYAYVLVIVKSADGSNVSEQASPLGMFASAKYMVDHEFEELLEKVAKHVGVSKEEMRVMTISEKGKRGDDD